jgi:hypothetical protein
MIAPNVVDQQEEHDQHGNTAVAHLVQPGASRGPRPLATKPSNKSVTAASAKMASAVQHEYPAKGM